MSVMRRNGDETTRDLARRAGDDPAAALDLVFAHLRAGAYKDVDVLKRAGLDKLTWVRFERDVDFVASPSFGPFDWVQFQAHEMNAKSLGAQDPVTIARLDSRNGLWILSDETGHAGEFYTDFVVYAEFRADPWPFTFGEHDCAKSRLSTDGLAWDAELGFWVRPAPRAGYFDTQNGVWVPPEP